MNDSPGFSADGRKYVRAVGREGIIFLILFLLFFGVLGRIMGLSHLISTLMNTAYKLLISTVFYIMAISVLAGAVSELFNEFGVTSLFNRILSPLIKPVYDLPGAAVVGIFACFFSDNPAILTLAESPNFRRYFKKYQIAPLTNMGTAFGMGLIIIAFISGISSPTGESFILPTFIGFLGAVAGSIVSTRLMVEYTKKLFGPDETENHTYCENVDLLKYRLIRNDSFASRFLSALLEGGKSGVRMGMEIIPGVLIICSIVMVLTYGMPSGGYTGSEFEGIGLLPWIGQKLGFILRPLFGFTSPEAISVPVTSIGAAGAAISLIPDLIKKGLAGGNDIAVFTAVSMCWSGYLSTHIAMLESLGYRNLSGRSILYHTIGGLFAGISAHWLYVLIFSLMG